MSPSAIQDIGTGSGMRLIRDLPNLNGKVSMHLIIRQVTEPFWNACIGVCERGPNKNYRACAVGTPGIGKSASTHYLIRMLLLKKKTVVYHLRSPGLRLWFYEFVPQPDNPEQPYACKVYKETRYPDPDAIPSLQNRSTYYIVDPGMTTDSCAPGGEFQPRVIIIAAPLEEYWGGEEFFKGRSDYGHADGGELLYCPLWSLEELILAKPYMFHISRDLQNDLTDATIQERYNQVGGVPRHILADDNRFSMVLKTQRQAIRDLSQDETWEIIHNCINSFGIFGSRSPRSAVIGYKSDPDELFNKERVRVLSRQIAKQVYIKYLGNVWSDVLTGKVVPKMLEIFAIYSMIGEKVQLRARKCVGRWDRAEYGDVQPCTLGGCEQIRCVDDIVAHAKKHEKVLYFPLNQQNPLIDFVYSEVELGGSKKFYAFQVTDSASHPAKEAGIQALQQQLGDENIPNTNLYYVVRAENFPTFTTAPARPKGQMNFFHVELIIPQDAALLEATTYLNL